jgi:hypothetical protein
MGRRLTTTVACASALAALVASAGSSAPTTFPGPGGKIALQGGGFGQPLGVAVVNPDGTGAARIPAAGGTSPVWSPDGRFLAYSTFPDPWTIRVVRADGTGDRELLPAGRGDSAMHDAYAWSPAGEIAYQCSAGLCAVRVATGSTRVIFDYSLVPQEAIRPTWSPDGSSLAFTCRYQARSALCTVRADGSDALVYVPPSGASVTFPDWSPDGTRILTSGGTVIDVDDGEVRDVTTLAGRGRWSPDGSRIAIWSAGAGTSVVPLDGSPPVKIADAIVSDWGTSPAVTVSSSQLEPSWVLSRQTGSVQLRGAASHASTLAVTVRSSGRTFPTQPVSVGAGSYAVSVPLPAELLPGPVDVVVGGTSGSEPLLSVTRRETLAAPATGLVSRSWISTTRGGAPRTRVARGTKRLFAQFAFSVRPAAGQRLRAVWLSPSGAVRSTSPVGSTRVVSTSFASDLGLQRGRWRCRLEAGRMPLAIASVRVG